jgi:predicted HAD superfamily phosphohydrolase
MVREGSELPDGTILDEITESGGVAINFFGDVAFHGRTGGVKAVFTQNGLIAKKGDPLADSTILSEIHPTGGVAINFYGDVAFHGKVGTDTDVVLVGPAPLPPVQ